MIKISQVAQQHFLGLLKEQEQGTNIKVFVINPGTVNAECGVSYCTPDNISTQDLSFEYDSFLVYIASEHVPFLEEAEIDLVEEEFGMQLTLKAPNSKLQKLPENASTHEKVDYFIKTEINPDLASHNGFIELIELTANKTAVIKFGGGCNGCSMVDTTLKNGVEAKILAAFTDDISSVVDVTEHERGDHSYF